MILVECLCSFFLYCSTSTVKPDLNLVVYARNSSESTEVAAVCGNLVDGSLNNLGSVTCSSLRGNVKPL